MTLAAVLGAAGWLALRLSEYEATARILVSPLPQDDQAFLGLGYVRDSGEATRTIQTAAAVVRSSAAADLAATRIGRGFTRERLLEEVEVKPQGESNILAVTARAVNPDLAADIVNEFARAALEVRTRDLRRQVADAIAQLSARQRALGDAASPSVAADLAGRLNQLETLRDGEDPTLAVSELASPPSAPAGAPAWLVLSMALIAGFMLGTGAALAVEFLDRRMRDEDEFMRLYPLPILARVPPLGRGRRAAAAQAFPPNLPPAVREAFRTLQVQLDQGRGGPRSIMLTSASTADGKTTSAINLAFALIGAGHRVILIDFDLRKPDVARRLGVGSERGLVSLLASETRLADLLVQAPKFPPLRVVPAGTNGDVVLLDALARRLPGILAEAESLADYVILDTPPLGEVSDALRLVGEVDDIIVVVKPGNTDRTSFELVRDLLERAGQTPSGLLVIGQPLGSSSSYYTYGAPGRDQGMERPALSRSLR